MPFKFSLLLLITVLASGLCHADIVLLRDGTEQEGEIVKQDGEGITLRIRVGGMNGTIQIAHREIAEVQARPVLEDRVSAGAETLKKNAEAIGEPVKAAEAWAAIGEYYQRHPGYSGQTRNAFERALSLNQEHVAARVALGYIKSDKGWALVEKPRPAPQEVAAAPVAIAAPADAVTIGLRNDAALIKRFQDEQQARDVAALEERRAVQVQPVYAGYSRDYYSNNFGVPYYTHPAYYSVTGCGYGYGNSYGNSFYGSRSYGGSNFSAGFRGGNRNFQFRGGFGSR